MSERKQEQTAKMSHESNTKQNPANPQPQPPPPKAEDRDLLEDTVWPARWYE